MSSAKILTAFLAPICFCACRQDMHDQPRYRPLQASTFFADGRSARPIPAGSIARGELNDSGPRFTGVDANGRFADRLPIPLTRELVLRGRERYDIYCSPCHGLNADAQGMVALRGYRAPPALISDRVTRLPVGYLFAVITNGYGGMPDYSDQIRTDDRWAVVTYIRALQLRRQSTVADVPADRRGELGIAR